MAAGATPEGTEGEGAVALLGPDDPFRTWRALQEVVEPQRDPSAELAPTEADLTALAVLDEPFLVLTEQYIGPDRRRLGIRAALNRVSFPSRRTILRFDVLTVLAVLAVVVGATLVVAPRLHTAPKPVSATLPADPLASLPTAVPTPTTTPATTPTTTPTTTPATTPTTVPTATPTVASPATPPATSAPSAAPPAALPATPAADPTSPDGMGAAALALVRYPWQQIPGYSIQFLPIADAPSPGFYGNTSFAWGKAGGVSTLYVYPGETVDQLAGIIAFEIAHEVDAAYVEPQGGHEQIAAILGMHPASWAPECDCAEQGYLSGWYAAAFSNYWSPGVGAWSTLAPPPSGAVLAAVQPWLDPKVS
jgi:hypothetical protein